MRTPKIFRPNGPTADSQRRRRPSQTPGGRAGGHPLPPAGAPAPPYPPTLLTNVTHLLSQPLTALCGSLELSLLTAQEPGELRLCVQEALEQGQEMVRRVRLLQELAEAEDGAGEAEPVWIGELAHEVIENLRPLAEARKVGLELHPAEDVQAWVPRKRFQQALTRIIYCTIQREPQGGTVHIELLRTGEHSCVEIRSNKEAPALPPFGPQTTLNPVIPSLDAIKESNGLEWLIATRLIYSMGGTVLADGPLPLAGHCRICLPLAGLAPPQNVAASVSRPASP